MAARAKTNIASKKAKKVEPRSTRRTQTLQSNVKNNSLTYDKPVSDMNTSAYSAGKKNGKRTLVLLALLVLLLGLLYYFKDLFVIATVNGKPISRISVVTELEKRNGKDTVDNLITKELILQEASKKGVSVSQEDVDKEMKKIEDDLSKQGQTLDQVLSTQGLTKADVEENLRIKLYIERLLSDQVSVSDDDAKKYFDDNKTSYAKDAKFDDVKDQIKDQLKQQKLQEKFQTWLADLKANSRINYFKTY